MKRIILILSILVFSTSYSLSQQLEDVGAGVIDFLLRNPKTANKMNSTETVALDIIGDLLKTQSQRKHQLKYASESRSQITINSNDGRQAQFVKDESGKVYVIIEGVISPVAEQLVNQAKNLEKEYYENYSNGTIKTDRFCGLWVNADKNTRGVTKFFIRKENDEFIIQMWGKCHPRDCYWGTTNANIQPQLNAIWNQGYCEETQLFEIFDNGNKIKLSTATHYTDNSERADQVFVYYFIRL